VSGSAATKQSLAQRLAGLVILLVTGSASLVVGQILLWKLHRDECPTESLISHLPRESGGLTSVAWLLFGVLLAFWTMRWFSASAPLTRRWGPFMNVLLLLCVPGVVFCTWLAAGGELCVLDSGVLLRANALDRVRHENWSSVSSLTMVCAEHGAKRRSLRVYAEFRFTDGAHFTISAADYASIRGMLAGALQGVTYRFNASDIDSVCPPETAALFARRP
jgi:hypothetical protein